MIPVLLDDSLHNEVLPPAHFTLEIGHPTCDLTYAGMETAGCLLDGVPVTVLQAGSALTMQTAVEKRINGSGALVNLLFNAGPVQDTCRSSVRLSSWAFDRGCLRPMLAPDVIMGMEAPASTMDITLHPEPNHGRCVLTIGVERPQAVAITLVDMLGRRVLIAEEVVDRVSTRTIDLGTHAAGVYLLTVQTADGIHRRVLTKE